MRIVCPVCGADQEQGAVGPGGHVECTSCHHTFRPESAASAFAPPGGSIAGLKGITVLGAEGAAASATADRYYIQRQSGKVFGPFEKALIKQMIESHKLSGNEGISQDKQVWIPILSVAEFAALFEKRTDVGVPQPVPTIPALPARPLPHSTVPSGQGSPFRRPGELPSLSPPGPHTEGSVHDEPTRAFSDLSMAKIAAPKVAPLPSLSDLPVPEPIDFDVSDIPGLTGPMPAMPSAKRGPDLPELPVPRAAGLPTSPFAKAGPTALPELPAPKGMGLPQLPVPKAAASPSPSIKRGISAGDPAQAQSGSGFPASPATVRNAGLPDLKTQQGMPGYGAHGATEPDLGSLKGLAELPIPKGISELPLPKGVSELPMPRGISELPAPRGVSELPAPRGISELPAPRGISELPAPKEMGGLPELPPPRAFGPIPELPTPKTAGPMPELPRSKTGLPELPLPRSGAELPILADGLDFFGTDGLLPELPTPRFDEVHLPTRGDDPDGALQLDGLGLDDLLGTGDRPRVDLPLGGIDLPDLDFPPQQPRSTGGRAPLSSGLEDLLPPPKPSIQPVKDLLGDLSAPPTLLSTAAPVAAPAASAPAARPAAAPARPAAVPAKAPATPTTAAAPRRAGGIPASRVALLAVLGLVCFAAVLVLTGVIQLPGGGEEETEIVTSRPEPVVVTTVQAVDLAALRAGGYGDYRVFLQNASAAVEQAQGQDRDALARLLVGQSLTLSQYGSEALDGQDPAQRVRELSDSDGPLQRLARGAVAASQGDVRTAVEVLEPIGSGELGAWAHFFTGLAELERYRRDQRLAAAAAAAPVATEATGEGTGDAPLGISEGSGVVVTTPTEAAPVAVAPLSERAGEQLRLAAELDPELVPAHYFAGLAAREQSQAIDARRAFTAALEVEPQHLPSLLALSEILIAEGEFEEVSRRLALAADAVGADRASSPRERSRVHYLLSRVALARRQLDTVIQELQRAIAADPSNSQALLELSNLYASTGRYQEAVDFFEQHRGPAVDEADLTVALARNRIGLAEGADPARREETLAGLVAELETARQAQPNDPRFPYYLGRARQAQNLFDEAAALYRATIDLDDQFRPAYLGLAELARLDGENEPALAQLDRAYQVGEPSADIDTTIGRLYRELGRTPAAVNAFRRAIGTDPFNMDARLELARCNIQEGGRRNLESALTELEVVEAAGVDDAELHGLFAEALYGLGYLNQARERMNRVAEHHTGDPDPEYLYLLGRINFDAGQLAEEAQDNGAARQYYETARESFGAAYLQGRESPEARFWEARSMVELGEIDRAVPIFRRAIDQALRENQPRGEYHYWLGYALEELGQFQQALEAYVLVDRYDLRWALANPELFFHRGRLFAQSRRFRLARRDLEWALILERDHAPAAFELAEVYALEQDFEKAIEMWLRSLAIDPDQPRAHYRLAQEALRLERDTEATAHLETARDMGYGDMEPDLYRTLGMLYKDQRRNSDAVRELRRYLQSGAVAPGSAEEIEIQREIDSLGGS